MVTHPDGSIWFVETSTNALGRVDRDGPHHRIPGCRPPNASLRGVTVGADGDLWFTENAANKIGPHGARRHDAGRIFDPDAGERRALHRALVGRPAPVHAVRRRA